MGKPLSKASEGGDSEIIGVTEDFTQRDVQHVSEKHVLISSKVRPCLRQAGRTLSDRLTHVRLSVFFCTLRFTHGLQGRLRMNFSAKIGQHTK
jgi:hypothetical protein